MRVRVNGEWREVAEPTTVAELVTAYAAEPRSVAVAMDGVVVPRATWERTELHDGAHLDVLTAVAGG